jgi:hypothetical protein
VADQRITTLRAFREISAQISAPDDAPLLRCRSFGLASTLEP